jgi:hypothetical protein
MLITGDPGLGKSAIIAEMVERREKMGVIAWFCCRWEQPDQLARRVFVEAIAVSLAENLPAYAQALAAPELQTLLEKAQTSMEVGPRTLFEQLVLSPLAKLPDPPPESRLILIDALDESLRRARGHRRSAGRHARSVAPMVARRCHHLCRSASAAALECSGRRCPARISSIRASLVNHFRKAH